MWLFEVKRGETFRVLGFQVKIEFLNFKSLLKSGTLFNYDLIEIKHLLMH